MSHLCICHICVYVSSVYMSHLCVCHNRVYVTIVCMSHLCICHICVYITFVYMSHLCICHICVYMYTHNSRRNAQIWLVLVRVRIRVNILLVWIYGCMSVSISGLYVSMDVCLCQYLACMYLWMYVCVEKSPGTRALTHWLCVFVVWMCACDMLIT